MAKLSSNKRHAQSKKYAGCMWGFMNLFDFRQGQRTPRLLSDKKIGGSGSKHTGNGYSRISLDSFDSTPKRNDTNSADEEMSRDSTQKNISDDKAPKVTSQIGHEVQLKKNNKLKIKKSKFVSDVRVSNLTSPAVPKKQHRSSIDNTTLSDLAAFLVQFYSHGYQLQQNQGDHDNTGCACPASEVTSQKVNNHLDEPDSLLNEKQAILKEAIADLTQMINSQSDEKMSNGFTQSNELLDVLNTLNTNKESILKILEHPDSLFLKQFQDYQDGQVGKYSKLKSEKYPVKNDHSDKDENSSIVEDLGDSEYLHKQSRHSFFWRHRSKATMSSQESPSPQAQNRIVVLKPNPDRVIRSAQIASSSSSPQLQRRIKSEENVEKVVPFFSLKEIKRRIENIFGESSKARHISMDGVLHKIPIGSMDSEDTDTRIARSSASITSARKSPVDAEVPIENLNVSNEKDKQMSTEESGRNIASVAPLSVVGNVINEEGRKNLAETVNTVDQRDSIPSAYVSKPIGRILSFPGYTGSSTKDHKFTSSKQNYLEDASSSFSSSKQNLEAESRSNSVLQHKLQMLDLKVELLQSHKLDTARNRMNVNPEGPSAPVIFDTPMAIELDMTTSSNDTLVNPAREICVKEEESTEGLTEALTVILPELATSLSPSESILSPIGSSGKPGRKSPASVLEKFCSEDITTPEWMTLKHSRRQLKPRQLHFGDDIFRRTSSSEVEGHSKTYFGDKQARLAYIKSVLEVSELSNGEDPERWYCSDEMLDSSMFDEVETSSFQLRDDPKLLFDCINDVLSEIQERHYKTAFISHCVCPAPVEDKLIQEVSKAVDRRLRAVSPNTVDQIMKRDMDIGTWMNFREEIEGMVVDIWDTLLDDLMEEAVFDFWMFDM